MKTARKKFYALMLQSRGKRAVGAASVWLTQKEGCKVFPFALTAGAMKPSYFYGLKSNDYEQTELLEMCGGAGFISCPDAIIFFVNRV